MTTDSRFWQDNLSATARIFEFFGVTFESKFMDGATQITGRIGDQFLICTCPADTKNIDVEFRDLEYVKRGGATLNNCRLLDFNPGIKVARITGNAWYVEITELGIFTTLL